MSSEPIKSPTLKLSTDGWLLYGARLEINDQDLASLGLGVTHVVIRADCREITTAELHFNIENLEFEGRATLSEEYIENLNKMLNPFGYCVIREHLTTQKE